ncbi:DNA mismatch repair protein MutS core [Penicillium taxi]|uniref:DNA mismatch repair protein MutS core n=1 Tax=Penicillium taxi TaxID=168475 RepID=UPI002544DB2F|nr:DNA mismatch repair protein MutS core [Penicillium taxi]KAJ5902185.1 DNA mismatch repair protein MutS core [Penicillium taxi]
MNSSQKRKQPPGAIAPPLITSRTFRSNTGGNVQWSSHASTILEGPPQPSMFPDQARTPCQTQTPVEAADSEQTTDDDSGHIIAAIDMKDGGTVGCAYYSVEEERMYLLGDSRSGGMEVINTLLIQIKPTVILTPPRVEILSIPSQGQNLAQETDSSSYLPYQIDVRPTQEFSHSNAENKLVALDLSTSYESRIRFFVPQSGLTGPEEVNPEDLGFSLHEGRLLHLSSAIDMENPVTIGCVGAVLTHLQKRRSKILTSGPTEISACRVRSLEMFSLQDTMWIGRDTFSSLQIIQSESHPNMFNQGLGTKSSSGKEGLSIFGLFRRFSHTPHGRTKLKQMFLRPSLNIETIRQRHDFVSVFSRPENSDALDKLMKSLKHIMNLRPVMINLQKGINTGSAKITGFKTTVWARLLAFAFYSIDIHDTLQRISGANTLSIVPKAIRVFEAAQLHRVDIDNSEEQGRTAVKQGRDRDLDRMKDLYDGLNSLLKHVAIDIASTIPDNLDIDVNVIYFPQLGFNIAIPLNERGEATYSGSSDDWDLVFITETRAYFKDFRMKELDGKLGDIYGLICEKEIEIVYDLAQKVLQYENLLVETSDICGELDSLLALTQAAICYKLVRPRMVTENVVRIKGGRHMIQGLTVPSYVPNDTLLVGGINNPEIITSSAQASQNPSMLVLTGPNYSGKSVYMKQVALIVYLAQIGSFVPADSAELGITDKILTKIHTQESVSKVSTPREETVTSHAIRQETDCIQIQSTFMNDLQQISLCLKQVTGRTLILIDEFGKGTNEGDGIGLACGILNYLLNLEDAPKVIAATHFHEIFENGFLALRPRLQLGHMEVKVCPESQELEDQVIYLYNLRPGRSSKSFGTICAAINGIEASIVARANEIASLAARGENLIAACAILSAEEMKTLQTAVRITQEQDKLARAFLKTDFSDREGPMLAAKAVLEDLLKQAE